VNRIWAAIQSLAPDAGAQVAGVATKSAKSGSKASSAKKAPKSQKKAAPAAREGSKTAQVIALLEKAKGASLAEVMEVTGWQAGGSVRFMDPPQDAAVQSQRTFCRRHPAPQTDPNIPGIDAI
jgi:hypothetical protein